MLGLPELVAVEVVEAVLLAAEAELELLLAELLVLSLLLAELSGVEEDSLLSALLLSSVVSPSGTELSISGPGLLLLS